MLLLSRCGRGGVAAVVLAVVCAVSLAGCSSSSGSGGGSSVSSGSVGGTGGATSGTASSAVASAQRIVQLASTKLLYGPTTGEVKPADLHAPTASDVHAFAYKRGTVKSIVWVSCAAISAACVHISSVGLAFAAKLGISGKIVSASYTPASNQAALNTALSLHPDVIVDVAIAPSTIGPQVARAKSMHIPIIEATGSKAVYGGDLSAYVPQTSNLAQIATAAQLIVDGHGTTKTYWLDAPAYPNLETKVGWSYFKSTCPTCSLATGNETVAQVTAPVPTGQLVSSILQSHPGLQYLTFPSACMDIQAAAAAARQNGTVKTAAQGCGAQAVAAMNAGYLPFSTGVAEAWETLQALDQALRLGSGQPALAENLTGPAAYILTPATTPTKSTSATYGDVDRWTVKKFNFIAPYSKAYGVDLSSVIADEK